MSDIDWTPYSEDGLTRIFFGHLYRSRHSIGDRRPEGEMPGEVDPQLGISVEEAKLRRGGAVRSGIEIALGTRHEPDKWAANLILTDEGEAYWRIPRDRWPPEVARDIAELAYRWARWALAAAARGLVELKYPVPWQATDGSGKVFESSVGKDGLPRAWHATHLALEEAERRVPIEWPEMMKGPRNALATASRADREHAANVAPWYAQEAKREDGAGV